MRTVNVPVLICLIVNLVSSHQRDDLFKQFESAVEILSTSGGSSASKECINQLKLLAEAYKGGKRSRASDMLDAWSNFRPRIQFGNTFDFGNFDECLRDDEEAKSIKGQHCLVQFYSKSNQTVAQSPKRSIFNSAWKHLDTRFGGSACLPATCSNDAVSVIVRKLLNISDYELATDYNQRDYCKTSNSTFIPSKTFVLLVFLTMVLLTLMTMGTVYDVYSRKRAEKKPKKFLISFSLIKNISSLFNVNECRDDEIGCLNGIRVLSAISIVFLHIYYHHAMYPVQHPELISEFTDSVYGRFVNGMTFSVDTFFVMSGLLATKTILADLEAGKFDIVKLYFQRYMRLTPTVAFVSIIYFSLGQYFVRRAPYAFSGDLLEPLEKYWWAVLLHLQVYTNPHQLVMPYIWYISVDWQMFLLAPLLIYPVWKSGRKSLLPVLLSSLVVISSCFAYRAALQNHLLIKDLKVSLPSNDPYFQILYLPTHFRGSSFLIGMILGHSIFMSYGNSIANSKAKKVLMWTLAIIILTIASVPYMLGFLGDGFSLKFNAYFLASARGGWSVSMAWFIFAFHSGCGYPFEKIGKILAHRYWKPISKLSFTLYIVHPTLQHMLLSSQKQPISFDHFQMINNFFGDLTLSTLLAIVVHLLVEEPLTQCGKQIYKLSLRKWGKCNKIDS